MKIIVLDGFTLNPNGDLPWEGLKSLGKVELYDRTSPEEIIERAKDAQVVLTNKTVLNKYEMSKMPDLQYIGVLATGFNVVDIEYAKERGIVVTNIPAYSTQSVAQMVFAHLLNITHRVGHYAHDIRYRHAWDTCADFSYFDTPLIELAGKKMGIVGFGHTGQAVTRIAQAMGLKVCLLTSKEQDKLPEGVCKAASLEHLLSTSDIVSLHCPLTADNKEMINAKTLSLMKDGAILINTGRGGLICEVDLADALKSGKLLAAGVDVLSTEPPAKDNPLLGLKNCFITPHIAWATYEARQRLMNQAIENLKSWMNGEIINQVNV